MRNERDRAIALAEEQKARADFEKTARLQADARADEQQVRADAEAAEKVRLLKWMKAQGLKPPAPDQQ